MENKIKSLQQENMHLKAQVYDLNTELQKANSVAGQMANEIMGICGIQASDEGISIGELLNTLKEKFPKDTE